MNSRGPRHLSLFLSAGLALSAFACGDDDGGGNLPDARPTSDAAEPDAGGGGQLRSGTIAVTEARITNTIGVGDPWSGGLVRISFSDTTTGNPPAPVEGFDNVLNSCVIQVWDVGTHTAADSVDEGAVQVTGTDNGDFACGFNADRKEYLCQSTTTAIAQGSLNGVTIVGNVMAFPAEGTQTAPEMVGMYMVINGFPGLPDATKVPIIDQDGAADTLTLFGLPDADLGAGDADSVFATFVGVGPLPTGTQFLRDETDAITISKAAGEVTPAITQDFHANGQGFTLVNDPDNGKYLPHTVPFTPGDVTFECMDPDCGATGTGGVLSAIVINGETTDGPVDGLSPADPMPDPVNQYATFTCAFLGVDSATLTTEMMTAILGTNPTRIQTSVGRYLGSILMDTETGAYSVNILQGHALLGWSDAPPK